MEIAARETPTTTQRMSALERSVLLSVLKDDDLLEFDAANTSHWSCAIRRLLDTELELQFAPEDLEHVRTLIELLVRVRTTGQREWTNWLRESEVALPTVWEPVDANGHVVNEVVVPGSLPKCSPSDPKPGHQTYGDPEDAPPHGTWQRYTRRRYRCRCAHCKAAVRQYRGTQEPKLEVAR